MPFIEVTHVTKHYTKLTKAGLFKKSKQLFTAVDDVSFSIQAGEKVGIVGLNGSGKSTLIKMLLGILRADGGEVITFSNDPTKNRQRNARRIGIVFGQRSQLRWDLPYYETLMLNKEIYGLSRAFFEKQVASLTALLDAGDFMNQPVRTLSLGQRMKAEIIVSLLHDPELIILDEPTIGLDVVTKNKIVDFLQALKGKTLLYTSHDLEDVERICSRIMILNQGRLLADISAASLAKIDTPAQIEVTLTDPHEVPRIFSEVTAVQLPNGNFKIDGVAADHLQEFMKRLVASTRLASMTIMNKKLEYLISTGLVEDQMP